MFTKVKTPEEIAAMRESGKMLATVLDVLSQQLTTGMTTQQLADIAKKELKALGGKPVFLGYPGAYPFPDIICISLNDEVVHGIPNKNRTIADGDVVSFDFGVKYRGMITDGAKTVVAGTSTKDKDRLIKITYESMMAGIAVLADGVRTGTIGAAVEEVLHNAGLGIVRDLVGHGVGHALHEDPNIPNYGRVHTGPRLEAGMTIAVEPMATMGKDHVYVGPDQWTILTQDASLSAHFEHTVLITESGSEILTVA